MPPSYKPARDLTAAEALNILGVSANARGRVTLPSKLGGVVFEYCDTSCKAMPLANIDPRFGVYLLRLATFLRANYGATSIKHAGIYPAGYGQKSHDMGIAIDLSAVDTKGGLISVLDDWGNKPKTTSVGYRLRSSDRGYDLFKDIYEFTSREGDDQQYGPPTQIGMKDSFIRHPDLQDAAAAALHKNHMHLQAGQTRTYTGPASGGSGGGGAVTPPTPIRTAGATGVGAVLVIGAVAGGLFFLSRQKSGGRVRSQASEGSQSSQSAEHNESK